VPMNNGTVAGLTVRFVASAIPLKSGLERFLPKLRHSAAKISATFSTQQAQAAATGRSRITA